MKNEDLRKLGAHYQGLLEQQKVFEDEDRINTNQYPVDVLESTINEILKDFPNMIPGFKKQDFYVFKDDTYSWYNVAGIRSYIGVVLGKLKAHITTAESTPITQHKDFTFISDKDVKKIIERDYEEIQRAFISKCWKSVIILCGGAIEALLLDLLMQKKSAAIKSSKAPKKSDIKTWDLADLINVAIDMKLINPGIDKLTHSLREYRNVVHPGNEIRSKLKVEQEEAKIALEVLNMLHRDLSP